MRGVPSNTLTVAVFPDAIQVAIASALPGVIVASNIRDAVIA